MKVLIVDDQKQLIDAVSYFLKQNKIDFDYALDGKQGLYLAKANIYDVIILDIMLPEIDGYEVLKQLRELNIKTPVLFSSAKGQIEDKVYGLNLGADDYIAKPFDMDELIARINALSRRSTYYESNLEKIGNISFDRKNHSLSNGDNTITLSAKEYEIFNTLVTKKEIVAKEYLIDKIWGYDDNSDYNKIEVYLTFLRRKLRNLNANFTIKSIRDTGYKLENL